MKKIKKITCLVCAFTLSLGGLISASARVVTDGFIELSSWRNAVEAGSGSRENTYTVVDYYTGYNVKRVYAFTEGASGAGSRSGTVYITEMGKGVITPHSSIGKNDFIKCYIGNDAVSFESVKVNVRVDI